MVVKKEWTNKDPKDAKMLVLTTILYGLNRTKTSVLETVYTEKPNRIQTRRKIKDGKLTKVMLGDLTTFNTGVSINLRTILLTMSNNGGGISNTIWEGNFMICK